MPDTLAQMIRAKYPGVYDDLSDTQLESSVKAKYPGIYDDIPTTGEKASRSNMETAGDVAKGFVKGAAHTALDLGRAVAAVPAYVPGIGVVKMGDVTNAAGNALGGLAARAAYGTVANPATNDQAFKAADQQAAYQNTPQRVGGALETVAEMAIPAAKTAEAIPTTAKAGRAFQDVMGAAAKVPVDISEPGNIALRIQQLSERGASMPQAVRKFLLRITDPEKAAPTYDEMRDFASNISKLSANERGSLNGPILREVAALRASLNNAVGQAAARAGKLEEYQAAMRDYANASRMRDFLADVGSGITKGLPYATGTGLGVLAAQKIKDFFGGD